MRIARFWCGCLSLGLALAAHAGDAVWTTTGPFGGRVQEIVFDPADPSRAYATTPGGVFRSVDGGDHWTAADHGIVADTIYPLPLALDAEQPATLYTFDSWARIYRSTDRGSTWAILPDTLPSDVHPATIVDKPGFSCTVLLGTATTGTGRGPMLYKSIDCGLSFFQIGTGLPDDVAVVTVSVDPGNANRIYAGLVNGGVGNQPLYVSNDGGLNFAATTLSASGSVNRLSFGIDGDLWTVVGSYDVFHSNNGGGTWSLVGTAGVSVAADPIVADRAWIASNEGVYRVDFDGSSLYTPTAIFGGLTPNPSYTATGTPVSAGARRLVWRPGVVPKLFASTDGSGIFQLDATGTTWSPVASSPAAVAVHALAIHPTTPQRIWAGQATHGPVSPALYGSSDGAQNWASANTSLRAAQIWALAIDPTTATNLATTTLYAAGNAASTGNTGYLNFGLYRSDDGGQAWSTIDAGLPVLNSYLGSVRALALDPRSCALPPCTTANGPLQRVYAVGHGRAPDDQLVADQTHRILRSDNRGGAWTDLSTNPGFPRSNFRVNELLQRVTPTTIAVDPGNPQVLYVGTEAEFYDLDGGDAIFLDLSRQSGLFKSSDGGATWTRVAGLPAKINSSVYPNASLDVVDLLVDPGNPQILWLAMRDLYASGASTVLRSNDAGATWAEFSNGINASLELRDLAFDPQNPNILYAAAGGNGANPGAVYRGLWSPGTQSIQWLSISIGLPAESTYTLAVDPTNPNQLHAGTDTGVYSITRQPDQDGDGIPDDVENQAPPAGGLPTGDGNGDGQMDSIQKDVGTIGVSIRRATSGSAFVQTTTDVVSGSGGAACVAGTAQTVDNQLLTAAITGIDLSIDGADRFAHPYGVNGFEILGCTTARVRIRVHGGDFSGPQWTYRVFAPLEGGNADAFGWYDFSAHATRVGNDRWDVDLTAGAFGSYRPDDDAIKFVGSPACLDPTLFRDEFETNPQPGFPCPAP